MPKQGFKNQWIAISQKGTFNDSEGVERDLNDDFLNQVISNTKPNDAPAVVGHPKDNSPAFGWATALRLNNGVLEAQFADTDDQFEQMVEEGKFRKRSASFYLNPPQLRHVGFLGAMPPAVKGLRDIQFNDGESVTVEISFNEEQIMKDEEVEKVADTLLDKFKGLFKTESVPSVIPPAAPATAAASFSEADAQKLIDAAVAKAKAEAKDEAKAEFAEQIKTLTETVNASSASGKRAEIVSFVESIPAEKGKHFLKNIGAVEFLEKCAEVDAANKNAEFTAFSEGEGDKKVEHKFTMYGWAKNLISALPPMIEFGEKFGTITATPEVADFVDPERAKTIKAALDVKEEGGDK